MFLCRVVQYNGVPNQINEKYVRGFFDGEGCVYVRQKMLIITNTNKSLIDEVRGFLESLKIKTHLRIREPKNKNHKKCYDIRIHDYRSIRKFHFLIGTNHHDKEQKIIRLINSYVKKPLSETEKKKIIEMREAGYTYRYIADFLHRAIGSIHRVYKLYQLNSG